MTKIDNPTDIRKAMLRNGWTPLANLAKFPKLPGWQTLVIDEALIDQWGRGRKFTATGGRLENALQIDNDTDHPVIDKIRDAWALAYPDHFEVTPFLVRGTDVSLKQSILFRFVPTEGQQPRSVRRTRRFAAPDGSGDHHVAFYTTANRQMGMFGPHNIENGKVMSVYEWHFEDPTMVKLEDVPGLTWDDTAKLGEIAERVYIENGFTVIEGARSGESGGEHHYDLADDVTFDCDDMVTRNVGEMVDAITGGKTLRCTATCIDGIPHGKRSRCSASVRDGILIIHDFDSDDNHSLKSDNPGTFEDSMAGLGSLVGEVLKDMGVEAPTEPSAAQKRRAARGGAGRAQRPPNEADNRADELLDEFVFWPEAQATVIKVETGKGRTFTTFKTEQMPWCDTVPWTTPQGNATTKTFNPADIWAGEKERKTISDVIRRPDLPVPFAGSALNVYEHVDHSMQGGSSAAIWELIDQLAPDAADRKWLSQWLAYKVANPWVPGPGIMLVAQDAFGTGRGTFCHLLRAIFGGRNVGEVPYHMFSGRSYQSQYNDWLLHTVVFVNEAEDTGEGTKIAARKNAWANLKQHIEPRMYERLIVRKGLPNTHAMVCASIIIAINDIEEVWLHENDRRCYVMYNGTAQPKEFWRRVNNAISSPADVAAFVRDLANVDLAGYDPYEAPPVTQAKRDMAEAGKSDLDLALDLVMAHLRSTGAELFSMAHVINGMTALRSTHGFTYWDNWELAVRRLAAKRGKRIGVKHGVNWYVMVKGKNWATYAWDEKGRAKWSAVDAGIVRHQLERAGPLDGTFGASIGALGDQLRD